MSFTMISNINNNKRFLCLLFIMFMFLLSYYIMIMITGKSSFVLDLQLMVLNSYPVCYSIIVDYISLSFSALVCLVAFSVFWFAVDYMKEELFYWRFMWLLFLFVISMILLIFSQSLFSLLLGWDGLGITSYLLIIYYQNKTSLESGTLTLMINRLGDVLIMSTFCLMITMGSFLMLFNENSDTFGCILFILMVAALTKSAQYPFSSWLPAAMAAPTPVSALVHSSTLVTAGIYLLIRVSIHSNVFESSSSILLCFGCITALLGGMCAMGEYDIKKIIALSTLSQLGVMVYSLGLNAIDLTLYHLFSHAMFKALLFMVAGWLLMVSYGCQDIRLLGGVLKMYPALMVMFIMTMGCLMGAPFVTGYYSKHLILELMVSSSVNSLSFMIMLLSATFSAMYMTRILIILVLSPLITPIMSKHKLTMGNYFPMIILFSFSVCFGAMFLMTEEAVANSFMLPKKYFYIISLIPIMGLLGGFFWENKFDKLTKLMSSMFFLMPLSKDIIIGMPKFTKPVMCLDYGWLEPKSLLSDPMWAISANMKSLFLWPKYSMSFAQGLTLLLWFMLWSFLIS
uniref:NADH-ubiquinone oxidoreductase chain 5 n=1 Tax=Mexistrophia reticulata TaxID=1780250 RepID=A0A1W6S4J9_9EUPU|nr:NADH dehydrogenase subunit 5 [Mexistrophia reticulata]